MFPVDQKCLRISLGQIVGTGGVGIAIKEGRIQRDRLVQRRMLIPRRCAENRIQPVSNADFCEGPERCRFFRVILPNGFVRPTIPSWVRSSLSPPIRKNGRAQVRTRRVYRQTKISSASRLPDATRRHRDSSSCLSKIWDGCSFKLNILYYTRPSIKMSSKLSKTAGQFLRFLVIL